MNISFKNTFIILLSMAMALTSCRKEETELIETPPEDTLSANSTIANLMQRVATNDGSNDNILDFANCFNIQLPVTVTANSIEVTINTASDYDLVESIFDEEYDDINVLDITFPISIAQSDHSVISVNNIAELNNLAALCSGENIADNDIECIDFVYPIGSSIFNTANELISTEIFTEDSELYGFIDNITEDDIISMNFPISLLLSNGSQLEVNSIAELQITIENEQNTCDEDDDFDYDDDDCDHCTQELLADFLVNCNDWNVDKLKKDSTNYDSAYEGYNFNFFADGTVSVFWNTTTVFGTWSTIGAGNNISVLIDIPALPLCNNNWNLQEISTNTDDLAKVDLRIGIVDRLRYRNTCN